MGWEIHSIPLLATFSSLTQTEKWQKAIRKGTWGIAQSSQPRCFSAQLYITTDIKELLQQLTIMYTMFAVSLKKTLKRL